MAIGVDAPKSVHKRGPEAGFVDRNTLTHLEAVWTCAAGKRRGRPLASLASASSRAGTTAPLLVATSRSTAVLFAQPSFPDGTGIVQTGCRCRIVRRAAADDESAASATEQQSRVSKTRKEFEIRRFSSFRQIPVPLCAHARAVVSPPRTPSTKMGIVETMTREFEPPNHGAVNAPGAVTLTAPG